MDRSTIICECCNTTCGEVADAVLAGAATYVELQEAVGCGKSCNKCRTPIEFLIQDVRDDPDFWREGRG